MICVLWKKWKFYVFDRVKSQNGPYLAKTEKVDSKFFICCIVHGKLPEYWYKVEKMWGEILLIFALNSKLKLAAETFVLHSGSKFTCLVVYFCKYIWFRCQTEIVSEKVYAVICPVLEITSLKFYLATINSVFL